MVYGSFSGLAVWKEVSVALNCAMARVANGRELVSLRVLLFRNPPLRGGVFSTRALRRRQIAIPQPAESPPRGRKAGT